MFGFGHSGRILELWGGGGRLSTSAWTFSSRRAQGIAPKYGGHRPQGSPPRPSKKHEMFVIRPLYSYFRVQGGGAGAGEGLEMGPIAFACRSYEHINFESMDISES